MPANKEAFSILMQKFQAEEFLLTGNIDPGRFCTLEPLLQEAEAIKPYITAVNVTDSLGALVFYECSHSCEFDSTKNGS